MRSLNKIVSIIALFIYPILTAARAGQYFDSERTIDAPNEKLNTHSDESISPIHDTHVSKPYSRQIKDITNELELYSTEFGSRVIIKSTVSPDDYPTLKSAISSVLNTHLKNEFNELDVGTQELVTFILTLFTFTPVSQRRTERTGRYLANTASTGRTVIDIIGETSLFGVAYDRVTKYEFNLLVQSTLEEYLGQVTPFDSLVFELAQVTSESPSSAPSMNISSSPSSVHSVSPSVNHSSQPSVHTSSSPSLHHSNEPSVAPSTEPTVTLSSQPSTNPSNEPSNKPSNNPSNKPSNKPSIVVEERSISLGEETLIIEEIGGSDSSGLIIAGVLTVVAVTMAIGLFAKKRYGLSMKSFRRRGNRRSFEGSGDESVQSRIMKRDPFFDQYVVECCTDNDLVFDDNDEDFFRPKSNARDSRDLAGNSYDVDTSDDTYDKLII